MQCDWSHPLATIMLSLLWLTVSSNFKQKETPVLVKCITMSVKVSTNTRFWQISSLQWGMICLSVDAVFPAFTFIELSIVMFYNRIWEHQGNPSLYSFSSALSIFDTYGEPFPIFLGCFSSSCSLSDQWNSSLLLLSLVLSSPSSPLLQAIYSHLRIWS